MLQDARRTARRRRHVEAVASEAGHDAVVEDVAVLLQHQAVAAAARLEAGEGVGIHAVQELGRVRAHDLDLAERRGVEDAAARAHGPAFAGDGSVHVLAAQREAAGALPQADILEGGTGGNGPIVRRRRPRRDRTARLGSARRARRR